MLEVVVVDYGLGNLRSVARALETVGARPRLTSEPSVLLDAKAILLPGVGAGDAAMDALRDRHLVGPLQDCVASGKPFLGVCLGLQLLMDRTDEGDAPCLGIIPGRVRRLPGGLKVPHMGWNQVDFRDSHPVFQDVPDGANFYFVHSYYADPIDDEGVVATTEYGVPFCSTYARGNLVATQFHPEKSGTLGLMVYHNFVQQAEDIASRGHQRPVSS